MGNMKDKWDMVAKKYTDEAEQECREEGSLLVAGRDLSQRPDNERKDEVVKDSEELPLHVRSILHYGE